MMDNSTSGRTAERIAGRTVVAWDGSAAARDAADWAVSRAVERTRPHHSTVSLVRVIADSAHASDYRAVQAAVDTAQQELNAEAARLTAAAPGCFVTTTLVRGDPFDELLRQTNAGSVLAVGAGDKRRGPFRRGSSLAGRLAAASNGPVAIIPAYDRAGRSGVVVGVDGSPESLKAVDLGAQEALDRREELILLHVWQEPTALAEDYMIDPELIEVVEEQGEQILEATRAELLQQHPELRVRKQLVGGAPGGALRDASVSATLLVIGSRHLHGLKRLFLGSVSHAVVSGAVAPTIVVGLFDTPTRSGGG